jgi:hypothetical protein
MKTIWVINTANETLDLVTMSAAEFAKCRLVRALSDGVWFNAYIHPDY